MTLENYNTLFILFLIITIILFILLIILFFVFDIRKIIRVKTGWGIRQSVKELNEINQKEGDKRRKRYKGHSVQLFNEQSGDLLNQDVKKGADKDTEPDVNNFEKPKSGAMVTVELEQTDKQTMLLDTNSKPHLSKEIPDSGDELKEELFHIFETKMIVFSNEIITKQGIISEIG